MASLAYYDDGSSTESETYFDLDEPEADERLGVRADEKPPAAAPSASVAASPSPSVTDGAKQPARGTGVKGLSESPKTATVTDSDSSIEHERKRGTKPREDKTPRPGTSKGVASVAKPSVDRAASRMVSLAQISVGRATGTASVARSMARKLSGSLRQSAAAMPAVANPLLERIEQGLSNPRPRAKRAHTSSAGSSPLYEELGPKRQRVESKGTRIDSGLKTRLAGSESKAVSRSCERYHSADHPKDEYSRASQVAGRSEPNRESSERRGGGPMSRNGSEELPSRQAPYEHRSYRSDHDQSSVTPISALERGTNDRKESDSRWSPSRYRDDKGYVSRSSFSGHESTRDPRRSQSQHGDAKRSDLGSYHSDYSSSRDQESKGDAQTRSNSLRDPRRSFSLHPDRPSRQESRGDVRQSSVAYSSHRDPRRSVSHHLEARSHENFGNEAPRASNGEYNGYRNPPQSPPHNPTQRARDSRLRHTESQSDYRRSPLQHHERETRQDPRGSIDEFESKRGRSEFQRSSSRHPSFRDDIARRRPLTQEAQPTAFVLDGMRQPPTRGYNSTPNPQQYESRSDCDSRQSSQHKQLRSKSTHRNERFVERRDDRECSPLQEDSRGYPPSYFEPAGAFDGPERTRQSRNDAAQRDGTLNRHFQSLQQERVQDRGYGRRAAQQLPPGYYLTEALSELTPQQQADQSMAPRDPKRDLRRDPRLSSPRDPRVGQARDPRLHPPRDPRLNPTRNPRLDPRRDSRSPRDPRLQPQVRPTAVQPAYPQAPPVPHQQKFYAQERSDGCPSTVEVGDVRRGRSRSVDPRRGGDSDLHPERVSERRSRGDGSYPPVSRPSSPLRRRELNSTSASESFGTSRDPRQLNASGTRPHTESSPLSRTRRRTDALLAEGKISKVFVQSVARLKLTSRFAERELNNPNSIHKQTYLLEQQDNMRSFKTRLKNEHPDFFHDVFEEIIVSEDQLERYSAAKLFVQRMLNNLRAMKHVENHRAALAAAGEQPTKAFEWRERSLEDDRKQLYRSNPVMFDRMTRQWNPITGRCDFKKPLMEEWSILQPSEF